MHQVHGFTYVHVWRHNLVKILAEYFTYPSGHDTAQMKISKTMQVVDLYRVTFSRASGVPNHDVTITSSRHKHTCHKKQYIHKLIISVLCRVLLVYCCSCMDLL